MTYGVKVSTEGQAEIVECDLSLGSMRRIVRGCIESISMPTRGGALAYFCDNAGRLERKKLPKNDIVSYLAGRTVVGTVLIMAKSSDGEVSAMSREKAESVCIAIENAKTYSEQR